MYIVKSNAEKWINRAAVAAILLGSTVVAKADAPLDLAATGTSLAGYVATAAGAAVALMAALYGVKVILRAFKSVK